jgi:hypothetical protein
LLCQIVRGEGCVYSMRTGCLDTLRGCGGGGAGHESVRYGGRLRWRRKRRRREARREYHGANHVFVLAEYVGQGNGSKVRDYRAGFSVDGFVLFAKGGLSPENVLQNEKKPNRSEVRI